MTIIEWGKRNSVARSLHGRAVSRQHHAPLTRAKATRSLPHARSPSAWAKHHAHYHAHVPRGLAERFKVSHITDDNELHHILITACTWADPSEHHSTMGPNNTSALDRQRPTVMCDNLSTRPLHPRHHAAATCLEASVIKSHIQSRKQ